MKPTVSTPSPMETESPDSAANPAESPKKASTGNSPTDIASHPRFRPKRLLVVDDSAIDREFISHYVQELKLPVIIQEAGSGSEAMQQITNGTVDLILLDYQLGDMTGTELLTRLKESNHQKIPAIMVTGMNNTDAVIEALRLGVLDYLPKNSLSVDSLHSVIESALSIADINRQLQEAQDRLRLMSLHDELTGLPNRSLFFDRLEQAITLGERHQSQFSVLMIDLNLFKEINDSMGHAAGDQVLVTVGQRMREALRTSDTLARLGGDEFACILHDTRSSADAITCVNKITDSITQPIAVGGRMMQVGASVGIALFPQHGSDAATLLSNADSAMYTAKRSQRNFVCFNEESTTMSVCRVPVGKLLYQAIQDRELFLEYQPKIDVLTRNVIGAEALVRWNSPKFGIIPPGDFIPVAERSNLIEDLTFSVMDMAFAQMQRWRAKGRNIPIAVNLSARMLNDRELPEKVLQHLHDHSIPPQDLVLEITETTLASSSAIVHLLLAQLLDAGIKISIDDFGCGFTSFRHIRDFNFSELKIDGIFIDTLRPGTRDAAIIRSVVLLADTLGMQVVAEGVETPEQLALLGKLGCRCAQGFGIARPMVADALTGWMDGYQAGTKL